MARVHVLVGGRVQGVGFRYATYRKAKEFGAAGWVRNLPDGRVEAVFEAERLVLESLVAWCHKGPLGAGVTAVEAAWGEETGEQGFAIQ